MIHRLEGSLYCELRVNGQPIPDKGNFYNHIIMSEGNGQLVPAMQISWFDDGSNLVDEMALSEANKFSLTVGVDGKPLLYTRDYRMFANQNQNNSQGPYVRAVGVLDVPNFYAENKTEYYEGTSDAALQKMAGASGLKYVGTATNDKQDVWLQITKTRAAFMNEVARHGWVDPLSFMGAGVTSLKELRYKNITDVFAGGPTATFVHNTREAGIKVKETVDRSSAGISDAWGNYGMHRLEHKLSGKMKTHKAMPVQKKGPFLPVNSEVAGQIGKRARMDYMLLDNENQHENYWLAYYQNQRKMALMSEKVSILVSEPTSVQLFDLVLYKQANTDEMKQVKQTDYYMVLGKTIVIKGGTHYAERIELGRYGLTKDGKSPLE